MITIDQIWLSTDLLIVVLAFLVLYHYLSSSTPQPNFVTSFHLWQVSTVRMWPLQNKKDQFRQGPPKFSTIDATYKLIGFLPPPREGHCYNLFPFSCLPSYLCNMSSLLLHHPSIWGGWSLLTHLWSTIFSLIPSTLVLCHLTGLLSPLTISLVVVTCPHPSIQFYDLLVR